MAQHKTSSPDEVADAHTNSDLDSSTAAQHHTLGYSNSQAAPGDHIHDGKTSKKLAIGTVTGAKGSNAALGSLLSLLAARGIIIDSTTA